jgi:hypothetical protein
VWIFSVMHSTCSAASLRLLPAPCSRVGKDFAVDMICCGDSPLMCITVVGASTFYLLRITISLFSICYILSLSFFSYESFFFTVLSPDDDMFLSLVGEDLFTLFAFLETLLCCDELLL